VTTISIKLHGERGERFDEIQDRLADTLGYEPSRAETVGLLMGQVDDINELADLGLTRRSER